MDHLLNAQPGHHRTRDYLSLEDRKHRFSTLQKQLQEVVRLMGESRDEVESIETVALTPDDCTGNSSTLWNHIYPEIEKSLQECEKKALQIGRELKLATLHPAVSPEYGEVQAVPVCGNDGRYMPAYEKRGRKRKWKGASRELAEATGADENPISSSLLTDLGESQKDAPVSTTKHKGRRKAASTPAGPTSTNPPNP